MAEEEEATTIEQIAEYESQLAGIVELLEASPGDESLLALKTDMDELLELSRASIVDTRSTMAVAVAATPGETTSTAASATATTLEDLKLPPPSLPPPPPPLETDTGIADGASSSKAEFLSSSQLQQEQETYNQTVPLENVTSSSKNAAAASIKKEKPHKAAKKSSKKQKKVKDFVFPEHLIPNDEDTDAERNKKRRAAKTLKNKWRLQKKEIESNNKQKSWQSFQKKSSGSGGASSNSSSGSIFATKEGVNDRVGVVSKKQLTEFGARKRHK